MVEYDDTLKPTGKLLNVKQDAREYDFSEFRKIQGTVFDKCYTNLEADSNGIARTSIRLGDKTVTVWQDAKAFPYTQGMLDHKY
jgi:hypothetical protein